MWHSGEAEDTIFLIAACTDKRPQDMDELKGFYKILAVLLDEEGPRKRFKSLNKPRTYVIISTVKTLPDNHDTGSKIHEFIRNF